MQGEDRRADIVAHAERLFAQQGYARTRMSDIADAAGVTKGLLYWYFESKEALIAVILDATRTGLRHAQRDAVEGIEDPLVRLYLGTIASVRFIIDHYRLYVIDTKSPDRSLTAALGESSQLHANDAARNLAEGQEQGLIRTDASPIVLAYANAGVVNNLCGAAHFGGVHEDPDVLARTVAGYVVRACAVDPDLAAAIEAEHSGAGVGSQP